MKMRMPGIDDFPSAPESYVPGDYMMEIKSYEQSTAKDGRTFFKVTTTILEGPTATNKAGETVSFEGRDFTLIVWPPDANDRFPDTSKAKFRAFLEEFGIPWDEEGYDPDDFVGTQAWVTLGPQKNNPEMMEAKRYTRA